MKSLTLGTKMQHLMSIHEDVNVYHCIMFMVFVFSQMLMIKKIKIGVVTSLSMSR